MKCIICYEREAVLPDRNASPNRRKRVCRECHAGRLKGDFLHILAVEKKRKEATEDENDKT